MTKQINDHQEWVGRLVREEVALHRLPEEWDEYARAWVRLEAVAIKQKQEGVIKKIKKNGVLRAAAGRNCEQMVGELTVPLAVAGPIEIKSGEGDYNGYVPLATTEGALVASIQRGMKATKLAGGIYTLVGQERVTRAPLLVVKDLKRGDQVVNWVKDNLIELKRVAETTSKHLILLSIEPELVGRNLWLRCVFGTGEAMGMNMVTIATDKVIEAIRAFWPVRVVALSGNGCVDKKPAWSNVLMKRGLPVQAEVTLPRAVVKNVLKTTPEMIVEVVHRKHWLGSMVHGAMGFNGHFANVVAAIFLATGQDMGHVVEGSLGITTAELVKDKLYFHVHLPDLMIGTVGGGTHLPVQHAGLELMDLGEGKLGDKRRLAAILGGTVLAGELSLTAALAAGHLAKAHKHLGRKEQL